MVNVNGIPNISYQLEYPHSYLGKNQNGHYHGQGSLVLPIQGITLKGYFYKGDFRSGTLTYPNGKYYQGSFRKHAASKCGTFFDGNFELKAVWDNGVFQKTQIELIFNDGNSFIGDWYKNMWYLKGEFTYILPDGNIEKVKVNFQNSNQDCMKEGQSIKYFEDYLKIEEFKFIDESTQELTFLNGDLLRGNFDLNNFKSLNLVGEIIYSEDRFPPFKGSIYDNTPISGEGTCYLFNTGILYEGQFDGALNYTVTESDGTFHQNSSKKGNKFTQQITYPDGKIFNGKILYRSNALNRAMSGVGHLKMNYNSIVFDGKLQNRNNYSGTFTNTQDDVSFEYESISRMRVSFALQNSTVKILFKDTKEVSEVKVEDEAVTNFVGNRYKSLFSGREIYPCKPIPDSIHYVLLQGVHKSQNKAYIKKGNFILDTYGNFSLLQGIQVDRDGQVTEYRRTISNHDQEKIEQFSLDQGFIPSGFDRVRNEGYYKMQIMGNDQFKLLGWK